MYVHITSFANNKHTSLMHTSVDLEDWAQVREAAQISIETLWARPYRASIDDIWWH